MRGALSLLFGRQPDLAQMTRGLAVLSCSERYDERIARRLDEWLPNIQWKHLKRFDPGFPWFDGETIVSSGADTLSKQLALLRTTRKEAYDVIVIAATNEPSYGSLKLLGLLANARTVLVFNENLDAFAVCRQTRKIVVDHFRWRMREKRILSGINPLLGIGSWVLLFPPAFLYLLVRTCWRVIGRHVRGG